MRPLLSLMIKNLIENLMKVNTVVFFPTIGEYDQDFESNPKIILSDIARELDIPNQ